MSLHVSGFGMPGAMGATSQWVRIAFPRGRTVRELWPLCPSWPCEHEAAFEGLQPEQALSLGWASLRHQTAFVLDASTCKSGLPQGLWHQSPGPAHRAAPYSGPRTLLRRPGPGQAAQRPEP